MRAAMNKPLLQLGVALFAISFKINSETLNSNNLAINSIINSRIVQAGGGRPYCAPKLRCSLSMTAKIYQDAKNLPLWSSGGTVSTLAYAVYQTLATASIAGLNPNDYHADKLNQILQQFGVNHHSDDQELLTNLDLTLTDGFLLYAKHLVSGRVDNRTAYPQLQISTRSLNLVELFNELITTQNLPATLQLIQPHYPAYYQLQNKLRQYQAILAHGGWESIPGGATITKGAHGKRVALLQKRLVATGELLQTNLENHYTDELKQAVIKYQNNNGLNPSGLVDKNTLRELNRSVDERIKIIELNLDRLRWLPLDMGKDFVLVNIPDFSLTLVNSDQIIMSMPVIVGKPGNQSCILSSKITYLELNPYWNVPPSIVRHELLPKLRHNPNYLRMQDIKVYTNFAAPALNPASIKWNDVANQGVNYRFRQMPGEKNALGQVKFIFPNACGIYLHDTPTRNLFKHKQRALSHGCIRIAKPLQLAEYLLRNKHGWDLLKIESQITSGKRQVITLAVPMDIHIIYATAWVDQSGELQFRNDLYKLDNVNYPPAKYMLLQESQP
jgi:murein L,D-transpeptidase YcbB/YkuD